MKLPINDIAMTAIFLWNGFMEPLVEEKEKSQEGLYNLHVDGLAQTGLACLLSSFAEAIEERFQAHWLSLIDDGGTPGVYHYEIIEELGRRLVNMETPVGSQRPKDVVLMYDELMAAWLVADRLIVPRTFNPITSP
jgi:hypothetical protein